MTHVFLGNTYRCTELSSNRILLTGNNFIKVFSLETYQELLDIPAENGNWDSLISPDNKHLFITTNKGLKQYSLPDLSLIEVHLPTSFGLCLFLLRKKNQILFNNFSQLLSLDLKTSTLTEFNDRHGHCVLKIASSSDEETVFTIGGEKSFKKWNMRSLSVEKSVELESYGYSLVMDEEKRTVVIGLKNGSVAEYSTEDLSHLRTVSLHSEWVTDVIRLRSGTVISCSFDGWIKFPFRTYQEIQVSDKKIFSISELSDGTIACACEDGLRVIPSLPDFPLMERLDSISSSIQSIRSCSSSSDRKSQLISLLQHHLAQLTTPPKTGLSISPLPPLKSLQRSHLFQGSSEGRKRIFTQRYVLDVSNQTSLASLTLFDRKLKLLGTISNINDPLKEYKVHQMRRGKWIFSMNQETFLENSSLGGYATSHFINGRLRCYVVDGHLTSESGFQATIEVDDEVKEISSIGSDSSVITSDGAVYSFDFETKRIKYLKMI